MIPRLPGERPVHVPGIDQSALAPKLAIQASRFWIAEQKAIHCLTVDHFPNPGEAFIKARFRGEVRISDHLMILSSGASLEREGASRKPGLNFFDVTP